MINYLNPLEPRGQATIVSIGLLTFVCVGLTACLALVVAAFYLAVQFVLIVLRAIVEAFSCIGATWASADPFLKLVILAALGYGVYRFYQWRVKRARS